MDREEMDALAGIEPETQETRILNSISMTLTELEIQLKGINSTLESIKVFVLILVFFAGWYVFTHH